VEETKMEANTGNKKRRWLAALVVSLLLIVGAQTAAIGYLFHKIGGTSSVEAATAKPGDWCLLNTPQSVKPNNAPPILSDPMTPLDPNSWNPFKEMQEMQDHIDAMFNNAFGRMGTSPKFGSLLGAMITTPKMDMNENGDEYRIRVDMPGADASKIDVSLEGNRLTVHAERTSELNKNDPGALLRNERYTGHYERVITLPNPVVQDSLKTQYENGVLNITIKKSK
jgi:HSP20 family protein